MIKKKTKEAVVNVVLDLDDFTEDVYDGKKLSEAIINGIRYAVCTQLEKRVDVQVKEEVMAAARKMIPEMVEKTLSAYLEKPMFTDYTGNKMNFSKWLENYLTSNVQSSYVHTGKKYIDELAKKFTQDLRNRYDLAFASHIVQRMADQNLLKDDAIAKLLDNK